MQLGIRLDYKLTFWEQIQAACGKAEKITLYLHGPMTNVGGQAVSNRRLLISVTHSMLLYGCEIWANPLTQNKYRKQMTAGQRRGALRFEKSYRPGSEPAVLMVTGVILIQPKRGKVPAEVET